MRKVTNNEQEIRQWAARNGAHPVELATYTHDSEPAQLSFVFGAVPGVEQQLRPIPWSQFFAMFHLMGLVLAYDDGHQFELLKMGEDSGGRFAGKPMQA